MPSAYPKNIKPAQGAQEENIGLESMGWDKPEAFPQMIKEATRPTRQAGLPSTTTQ